MFTLLKKIQHKVLNNIRFTFNCNKVYRKVYLNVKQRQHLFKKHSFSAIKTLLMRSAIKVLLKQGVVDRITAGAVYCEVANFLLNSGQPEVAQTFYELSLQEEMHPHTYSLYLQCILLSPSTIDAKMFTVAKQYYQLFLKDIPRYESYENILTTDRRLKIGYVCHFFHNSVSQSLLIPFLKAHNRNLVEVFCYSDAKIEEVPSHIKAIADEWRDTLTLSDDALAEQIRKDQIDILLELNGHCICNRFGVIAQKPAPIQVSYYNLCATTGIPTIDYTFVGDEVTFSDKNYYAESLYFMKGVTGIAQFPLDFPNCAPPPVLEKGYITFGSFGAAHKVNSEVIRLWCKVLQKVPSAHFYMKAGVLDQKKYVKVFANMFQEESIALNRVHFEGFSEHRVMLQRYAQVDIALDTFPHGAGTTTMEAVWQGVPVLSLSGERFCEQNGKSILGSIGHPELIAYSEEEFVEKAVALASDQQRLNHYRLTLREAFRTSPRGNPKAFAQKLEIAYQDIWARYCLGH